MEANNRQCHRQDRRSTSVKISGLGTLVELERLLPPELRRNKNA